MDNLPDLQSDADVDALMARLRSKLPPATPAPLQSDGPPAGAGDSDDRDALEVELASVVVRAMQVVSDTLDDIEIDGRDIRATPVANTRPTRTRQTRARRKTR